MLDGIHEFIPVLFEDANFCVANMIVHTIRLDYRFRVIPIQVSEFARFKPEERLALMDIHKNQPAKQLSIYDTIVKQLGRKTVNCRQSYNSSTLFPVLPVDSAIDYETMYNVLVESLKKTYAKLYNHFNKMNSRCILEKQKKTFKKYLVRGRHPRTGVRYLPTLNA